MSNKSKSNSKSKPKEKSKEKPKSTKKESFDSFKLKLSKYRGSLKGFLDANKIKDLDPKLDINYNRPTKSLDNVELKNLYNNLPGGLIVPDTDPKQKENNTSTFNVKVRKWV